MAVCLRVRRRVHRPFLRSLPSRAAAVLALIALAFPTTASAYHFFYLSGSPVAWRTLPITAIIDNDTTSFTTIAMNALNVWNGVTTAKDMFGTPTTSTVNFTGANYLTAWGMTGDGKFEIVCDTDGSALTGLGLSSVDTLGYGPTVKKVVGGQSAITDGFFILNCKVAESADFSYLGTMVHELGHDLGLAHSPVYQGAAASAGSLEPVLAADAPTMYPFSIPGNDAASATLEADDIAAISELYPETTFATTYGTLSGTVTRCNTNEPIMGAIVRAVSISSNKVQISRYSAYDANAAGRFNISVPAGTYHLLIEVLQLASNRMAMLTTVDKDFDQEYYNPPDEAACSEDLPDTPVNVAATTGATTANLDFKTNAAQLAFVVDDTGSMTNEIPGVRSILTNEITRLKAITTKPFPTTAIVSFKDNVTVRKVSRDPVVLQNVVNALFAGGGGDCPEHSNDALLVAGKLLRKGGTAMLFTDADSHPTGASSADVSSLYREKSLRLSTLLSGSCTESISLRGGDLSGMDASQFNPALSANPPEADDGPALPADRIAPPVPLGTESSVKTFSIISTATGGFFTAIPGIKYGGTTETARYVNTGTNVAVSAVVPTVAIVSPGDGPMGATLDVLINGSSTNFQGTSTVTFGAGITVNSFSVLSATQLRANVTMSSSAATGFRDVTVTTPLGSSAETATGVGAFNVMAAPTTATITSTLPATGGLGATLDVTIRGVSTSFSAGTSTPLFCTGYCYSSFDQDPKIKVNSTTVVNATTLVANITIAADAKVAFRSVTVLTGTRETARENVVGPFLVTAPAPAIATLSSVTPGAAGVGQTLTITITGQGTSFVDGTSVVSLSGTGVTVNSTKVTSATAATANITIASSAALGFRDVLVTTGSEVATVLNAFNVLSSPCAYSLAPVSATVAGVAGTGTVALTTQTGCPWTATSSNTAVATITSAAGGSGPATIAYAVSVNPGTASRTATLTIGGQAFALTQTGPPQMALDKIALAFCAAVSGATFTSSTSAQQVRLTQTNLGTVTWTATSSAPWLTVSPASGTGSATLTIGVTAASGLVASQAGTVTLTFTGAANTAGPIAVTLATSPNGTTAAPFGSFDTPTTGATGLTGSIPVTGWALDDVEITAVRILRDPVAGETPGTLVPIGTASLVEGARPDVAGLYSTLPRSTRAGWGYLMLTNFLPSSGNGTFKLYAYADDPDGHSSLLGTKTITCANATGTEPFGAIDTPGQGAAVSGALINFGWVLSPGTRRADPPGGGTVKVVVDGAIGSSPGGWTNRADLTGLFPAAQYSGIATALGVQSIDTTALANGTHTLSWLVTDNGGLAAGIGSRYFTVSNGSLILDPTQVALRAGRKASREIVATNTIVAPSAARARLSSPDLLAAEVDAAPVDASPVLGRRGYDLSRPILAYTARDSVVNVQAEEIDRIELHLPAEAGQIYTGYLRTPDGVAPLPIGSRLDSETGEFTWQPGVAFVGPYLLEFVRWSGGAAVARQDVRIVLNPKGSSRGGPQVVIDTPPSNLALANGFVLAGWAADLDALAGTGVDRIHVWAYPVNASGHGDPVFVGAATYGGARPDVAAEYGDRFAKSGYGLTVQALPAGTYDIAVFAYSTVQGGFVPAQVVRVTIK